MATADTTSSNGTEYTSIAQWVDAFPAPMPRVHAILEWVARADTSLEGEGRIQTLRHALAIAYASQDRTIIASCAVEIALLYIRAMRPLRAIGLCRYVLDHCRPTPSLALRAQRIQLQGFLNIGAMDEAQRVADTLLANALTVDNPGAANWTWTATAQIALTNFLFATKTESVWTQIDPPEKLLPPDAYLARFECCVENMGKTAGDPIQTQNRDVFHAILTCVRSGLAQCRPLFLALIASAEANSQDRRLPLGYALYNWGWAQRYWGEWQSALATLTQGHRIAAAAEHALLLRDINFDLSLCLTALGRAEDALRYERAFVRATANITRDATAFCGGTGIDTALVDPISMELGRIEDRQASLDTPPLVSAAQRLIVTAATTAVLTVAEVANRVGVSRRTLEQAFRRHYGSSPGEYIDSIRLDNADRLLRLGFTVTEAAEQLGYGSASALSKAYKRYFGTSPTRRLLARLDGVRPTPAPKPSPLEDP
ncbi:MAG: helix-turn-helix domain-containing protein [Burkholderiales bacterium]|nr:helix-turn-helix domain-containing protein [Burkholderiales bacterium]